MDKNKTRPKRKASEDYERGITKRTRQTTTGVTSRPTSSVSTRYSHKDSSSMKVADASKDGNGTQRSSDKARPTSTTSGFSRVLTSADRDANRLESKSGIPEKEAGSSGTASTRAQSRAEKLDKQRLDVSKLDSKIMEMVGSNDADLFKLVYNISIGTVDPVKCVDVIRFYLSNPDYESVSDKDMTKSISKEDTTDKDDANASCNGSEERKGSGNGMLIFKLLDLVSFFLDVSKKKTNLLYFLQALETLGINKEIISTIDANKLDNCNYSEGLVKILIRERTRNNYVLKVFNLYRECPKGFLALTSYLTSINRSKVNKGVADGVSNGADVNTVSDTIKKITGSYKLCPLRVLYEVLNWLVLGYFNEEFVLGLLSMYNVKQIRFCVLFYLQVNSGVSDKSNLSSGGTEEVKESAGKDSKGASSEVGANKQGESEGGSKASNVESGINTTCSGIYYLVALLVTNNYMRLEDVYKYLNPSDALIKQLSSHFISTVKSGSVSTNLDSSVYGGTGGVSRGGATKPDNVVLVDLLKSASFYTISNEYLNSCEQNSSKARRVEHMVEIFSDPKYSGFPASFTSDQSTTGSHKDESPSRNFSGAGSSSVSKSDTNPLLSMNNYRLLKNCFYAYNFPKVALLSNILGLCEDFTGGNWNLCYSLIVHLFRQGYYVFFNTSLVHRFNGILGKVLDGSSCSTATKTPDTTSTKLDLAKEWVILKKVEYYFMFVGFRACEDTVLFNRVLRYLYNLLQQMGESSQKSTKGSGKGQKNAADGGSSGGRKLKLKVTKIIYKYVLFNIMNCCEGNFQVSDKIWNILKMFTTLERYQIYSKSYQFLTKYKLDLRVNSMMDEDNSTTDNSEASVGSAMRTMYYVNQLWFVRRTHQIYNHKLKNIFKKITGELLRSVKSPTIRSIVSIITAISAINPFSVGTLIIKQSEMFNNLLLPLCELTKYFQAYTIDVFIYQLTVNLLSLIGAGSGGKDGNGRGSAKSGGYKVSLSDMRLDCNNLMKEDDNNKINVNSIILCKIFKRHNECDIAPLITVLVLLLNYSLSNKLEIRHSGSGDLLGVNSLSGSGSQGLGSSKSKKASATANVVKQVDIQLDSNNYYDVVFMIYKVLDYLINLFELMNGIIIIDMNKMTKDQLLSQCGSFSLKTESQLMNLDDEINLSNKKVFKIVSRPFFLHSLLLILGRLLNELVYDSYFTNHKLLVEVVNKYHSVVMLLVEFLSTSTNEITGNTGINRVVTGALSEESGLLKYDSSVVNEFLSTLSKYYGGNYIDFFRQYLFGGVNSTGDLESSMASGGEEESVLEDKFVEYVNTLNIYDIYVPVEQYDHYINKLLNHYNQLSPNPLNLAEALISKTAFADSNASSNKTEPASPVNPNTRSSNTVGTRITNGTLMRRLKRIKNRITALTMDKQSHQSHNSVVLGRLKEMLQSFVKNEQKVGPHVTIAFISKIIYPRVFISVLNSMFCCKLVDLMMVYRVNYFNYFDFVNCYCKLLVPLINYSTEAEVINFSLFFNYSFNMIKNWINSKEAFENMVKDNPCFCLTFRFNPEKQFKYEQLLQVLKKWEYLILVSLFSCYTLTSTDSKGGNRGTGPTVGDVAEGINDDASDKGDVDATNVGEEGGDSTANEEKIGSGSEEATGDNSIESITTNNDNGSDQDVPPVSPSNKNEGKADGSDSIGDIGDGNGTVTYASGNDDSGLTPVNSANVSSVDGATSAEPIGKLSSWIEIKNVVIFLNKVSGNFPVSHNSSVKVVNFLKSVLKVSKRENWQDVTVSANTLIKTMQIDKSEFFYNDNQDEDDKESTNVRIWQD
ncbi:hypothetical protein MACK_002419 [Theileria orientalis]|uniref:THO complex subunit 2 n=1 Tax=Theileria orientalis TaxID=68886 RepID=A0A976MBL9_THEOR|nr:hypothetical protein MACK_002419 [Theileria orientalis]